MKRPTSIMVALWAKNFFIGLGVLAALLTVGIVGNLLDELHNTRVSTECRFDLNTAVNQADDAIDTQVALIIVAAVNEDDARVAQLGLELPPLIEVQREAARVRANAEEECNA